MKSLWAAVVFAIATTVCTGGAARLEWVRSSFFGTAADDNFEGAAVGPEGCLYLVGNAGASMAGLEEDATTAHFGEAVPNPKCGRGFVLKLSPDGAKPLAYADFAEGVLHATAISATTRGVYVGGFASHGLEPLLAELGGLMPAYPLRSALEKARRQEADDKRSHDPIAGRPWLNRLGAPCVVRLSLDLKTLEAGTYLEGWQQVYDKNRVCGHKRTKLPGRFREFFWQPINICPLASGDVAVAHDGGYFREATEADHEAASKLESERDRRGLIGRLCFYDTADYVSRLDPTLNERRWKTVVRTPPVDQAVASRLKKGWPHSHFGSPRIHRMRLAPDQGLWVAGWSATLTSSEPWWSPFLWRLDPESGQPTKRLYEHDPMSGGRNRMGGLVADTAVLSVAVEEDGDLLTCLISDGGNTWMLRGPRGAEGRRMLGPLHGPGLGGSPAHFWGQVHRVDAETNDGLGGVKTGPWAWTIDAAGAPDEHFLALGRWNHRLPWTADAWWKHSDATEPNPNAFLRLVAPDYTSVFWTAIPGVRPFEILPIGDARYIVTGFAANASAPVKDGLANEPLGGEDAYFMIVRYASSTEPEQPRTEGQ